MRGGFSLTLSEDWPARGREAPLAAVGAYSLHRGQAEKELKADQEEDDDPEDDIADETDEPAGPDRGYFVDVKTLAAALTSKSHSLASFPPS